VSDEPTDFAAIVAAMDTAMVVVTAADERQRSGCLVGFHSQCSIEPLRYCVWISTANHTYPVARASARLAVHVLDEGDGGLAALFGATTGDEIDKFARCAWRAGPGGVPVLTDCRAGFVGRRVEQLEETGDHVGFVVAPDDGWLRAPVSPLRFARVADLDAGHPASESGDAGPRE
jgi:flavin reductase (DIM6/NTAB) family NADH-FMN oxidoreductase RutF